ncbi:MAG: hypothetical protein A2X61_02630 [Ignavibacteria bacterium GWB2_35_12]|nr:MAG: hypothetical protein A2X63_11320 [Ignavibacteria bacterium GWA2_35_8]OGU42473.1 MAG: hypothetical protein A2X61_02630 [Ignavibacteria bacterium GWB2_35_12]OGU89877.1 MAG: hypothetical protein A2220_05790 [Ignavibacteria bacterium RIFOXYA2_FULL_35_10]OGV24253.1 MAG: hypothetical protein A2475_08555 [Ignavibacteria bacterium RIFOXYC2_FULL_35_21]
MAWRSVWGNWRRSAITIAAIAFAAYLTIIFSGVNEGTYGANIRMTCDMFTGYLQIQKKGYIENPTLIKTFHYTKKLENKLKSISSIKGFTSRITTDGLVSFKNKTSAAMLIGLDPKGEKGVSKLKDKVKKGLFIKDGVLYDIVVGYKMLDNLKASIGDTIVILTSAYDGTMGNLKFRIAGTSRLGSPDMDAMSIFMHIDAAKELLVMGDRVCAIVISLNDLDEIPTVKKQVSRILPKDLVALDWGEVNPELRQMMEMDSSSNMIYYLLIIIIISFGIMNTVLMSITERFRQFGVMLAIGMRNINLISIIFIEMLIILIIGLIIGNTAGYFTNYYLMMNPIELGGEMGKFYEEFGFEPAIFSSVVPKIFVSTCVSIIIISVIVFIYPAFRVMKLEALKGIRYT